MNILILGVYGQLGSELQRQLISTRSPLGDIPTAYHRATVTAIDIDTLDITDAVAVTEYITNGKFDLIFNCAAYTDVDGCEVNRKLAYAVNSDAPGYIAKAAKAIGAKFVHVSTDYVFEGNNAVPRNEYDETLPVTIYGKSKLYGENRILQIDEDALIIRTAWLYGVKGKNFVRTIMSLAKENGTVKVVNDQIGNPTNAADLAYHLLKLALSPYDGIFHCTNNGICSWYDFACRIIDKSGIEAKVNPCTTEEFPRPARRPKYSALENLRLRETVGDEMRSWQDAIDEFIKNICSDEKENS